MILRAVVVAALAAAGVAAGWFLRGEDVRVETETARVTVTRTAPASPALPAAVERTRAAIAAAASARDYDALERLLPDPFKYTFGENVPGGPVAYWRDLEQRSDEDPIGTLAKIMSLPYTLSGDYYVWPFAYDKQLNTLGPYGRELLGADLLRSYAGEDYYGWRAAIDADGVWRYYVSGD